MCTTQSVQSSQRGIVRPFLLIVILAVTGVLFFVTGSTAFAEDYPLSATVWANGDVYFTCPETGNMTLGSFWKGEYPAGTAQSSWGASLDCATYSQGLFNFEDGWYVQTGVTEDGTYYGIFNMNGSSDPDYRITATRLNGAWSSGGTSTPTTTPPEYTYNYGNNFSQETRFINATTTARTTTPKNVLVDITYFLDPNEVNVNVSQYNPSLVTVKYANRTNNVFTSLGFSIATTTGTGTVQAVIPDADIADNGTFDLLIQFSNQGCVLGLSPCPFSASYIYSCFTLTNKAVTYTCVNENYNIQNPLPPELRECSLTNPTGCIINAFNYLFIPTRTNVSIQGNLAQLLPTKAPFSQRDQIKYAIENAKNYSATQNSTLSLNMNSANMGTLVILSESGASSVLGTSTLPILRDIMGYAMWVFAMIIILLTTLYILNPKPE